MLGGASIQVFVPEFAFTLLSDPMIYRMGSVIQNGIQQSFGC